MYNRRKTETHIKRLAVLFMTAVFLFLPLYAEAEWNDIMADDSGNDVLSDASVHYCGAARFDPEHELDREPPAFASDPEAKKIAEQKILIVLLAIYAAISTAAWIRLRFKIKSMQKRKTAEHTAAGPVMKQVSPADVRCPVCGASQKPGVGFCGNCGTRLSE